MSRRPVAQDAQPDDADNSAGTANATKHHSIRGPRANEEIGAGNIVFKRGGHGRLHPKSWPFEHPDMRAAVTEAERLNGLTGETFEVYARVATVGPCDVAGGMPVEATWVADKDAESALAAEEAEIAAEEWHEYVSSGARTKQLEADQ